MAQSMAGGFIIVSPEGHSGMVDRRRVNPFVLENRSLKVSVVIHNQVATTTIEQVFYNPTGQNLQGYFMFPVPKGTVLTNFMMDINGKLTPAELLDATKAKQIYENIVRQMLDPALLEYAGQDLFKVRIFPLEAHKEKRIKITYSQVLEVDNQTMEYAFPLNIKKYSAKPLQNLALSVQLDSDIPIKTLYSPSHEVEVIRKGDKNATVGFEAKTVSLSTDFKLFIGRQESRIGASLLTHKAQNEGYFLLNIAPGFITENDIVEKDISFVLDVSGSMSGEKIEQAKRALLFCVNNLNQGDRFEIIKFSTEAQALFQKRGDANSKNKQTARDFIQKIKAIGGTNMQHAFELVGQEASNAERPHMIIFITDGKPTIGETQQEALLKQMMQGNNLNTRIFTFGIGDEINTHLLDKLTLQTKAYRSYISPTEDIEIKISNFYQKISSPILTDVKLEFAAGASVTDLYPKQLPDLFRGSSITVMGRYGKAGKSTVKLTGNVNGKTESFSYSVNFQDQDKNDFIAAIWATRKIGFLLDQIRLNGENKELVDEVVRLAKQYGIITPYTSYLILEDEQINITNNQMGSDDILFNSRVVADEYEEQATEYQRMVYKSGRNGVQSSAELQNLSKAEKINDSRQGASRMAYVDKEGRQQNLAEQSINIQGRAFYQTGNQWTDLYVQKNNTTKTVRIQFASKAYFDLLQAEPSVSEFLYLGRNVRFVYQRKEYLIYE